jgi:AbiV family abortive infection protein
MILENVPTEYLINGINKAYSNADSLLQEARILEINKKWPRAYVLCQLAIEELGKISLLFQLWIDRLNKKQVDYKKINSDYVSHLEKTRLSITLQSAFFNLYKEDTGDNSIDKHIQIAEYLLGKIPEMNDLKNNGLYTGINGNDFRSPNEIIDSQKFDFIFDYASKMKLFVGIFIEKIVGNIEHIAELLKGDESK